jgi:hypothetical protein
MKPPANGRRLELFIESIDAPIPEIRRIERWTQLAHADTEPRVDRAIGAVVDHDRSGTPLLPEIVPSNVAKIKFAGLPAATSKNRYRSRSTPARLGVRISVYCWQMMDCSPQ